MRDVTLWALSPPSSRSGFFHLGAAARRQVLLASPGLDERLRGAATTLSAEILNPGGGDAGAVVAACQRAARRAEALGLGGTALAFAQAAAVVDPGGASLAHEAGCQAAAYGEGAHAAAWLRRSVALARGAGDWSTYCRSLNTLGSLREGAAPEEARRHYLLAMRAARRHGMQELRAAAAWALLHVSAAAGRSADVGRYGSIAQRGFGPDHPQLPHLLLDLARAWIRVDQRSRARGLLRHMLARLQTSGDRFPALALLARAEADPRNRYSLGDAWPEGWSLAVSAPASPIRSRALTDLALAAAAVGATARSMAAAELVLGSSDVGPDIRADLATLPGAPG